jgi:hypothetical protein
LLQTPGSGQLVGVIALMNKKKGDEATNDLGLRHDLTSHSLDRD